MNNLILLLILFNISFSLSGCSTITHYIGASKPGPGTDGTTQMASNSSLEPDVLFRLLVAEVALHRGQLQVALDNYLSLALDTGDADIAKRATRIAGFAQADDDALKGAQLWVMADPNSLEARKFLAVYLFRDGQSQPALEQLEELISRAQDERAEVYMQLVTVLAREKDQDATLELLQRLANKLPQSPHAHLAVAHLATRFSRFVDALQASDMAIKLKPDWPDAIVLRTRILEAQGKTAEAIAYFEQALVRIPDNTGLRMALARMFMNLKRMDEAFEQYTILAKKNPDNSDIIYAIGLLSLQTQRIDEAHKYLSRLYEQGKHKLKASFYLGQIEENRKQFTQAIEWYGKVKHGELYVSAQMRIAAILAKQNQTIKALDHLMYIRARNSQDQLQLYLLEGDIMLGDGQYQEAFTVYDRALLDMPDDNNLLYAHAIAAEKINRLDILENDLRAILERDPDNAQALNALGFTLADRTERFQEAFRLIERAQELSPKDPAITDSMGWIHYRLGNLEKALHYLRRALEIMDDIEIAAHLGEVLWVSDKKEEAVKVWNKALIGSPDNEIILKTMQRFGL